MGKCYKCGHKSRPVLICDKCVNIAEYLNWRDTVGYAGDKSLCFSCWCKKRDDVLQIRTGNIKQRVG